MLTIDGSFGEGGGQILRSSLTLSLVTGTPFEIERIRAGRKRPGLMPQHLRAVAAAATISGAAVEGAEAGSQWLRFRPGPVRPGRYHFRIGTAGSTALVLQTIYLPLALAGARSLVEVAGGTHVPFSPTFDYLERHWAWALERMGLSVQLSLERAGFYPKGGGLIRAVIPPGRGRPIRPVNCTYRGRLVEVTGSSMVANLPESVGERQRRRVTHRLGGAGLAHAIDLVQPPARGKCTAVTLLARFAHAQSCHTALGERGKPAERVADEALDQFFAHLQTGACLDRYLADQVLLPLALAEGPSAFTTSKVTEHLKTNAEVVRRFLAVDIEIEPRPDGTGYVTIRPETGGGDGNDPGGTTAKPVEEPP